MEEEKVLKEEQGKEKQRLKTLADCKPSEFLRQTNRIRKAVFNWITVTDIVAIRARLPKYEVAGKDASAEEKAGVIRRNAAALKQQQMDNMNAILDAMMDKHPDETLEVLALCCFVEPEDVDNHDFREYIDAFSRLISDEVVVGFFTSLLRLEQTGIVT